MKMLKKMSAVIMAIGIFIILGVMGESDYSNLPAATSLRGVLLGGGIISFGKAAYAFCTELENRSRKSKRILFIKERGMEHVREYKRAV